MKIKISEWLVAGGKWYYNCYIIGSKTVEEYNRGYHSMKFFNVSMRNKEEVKSCKEMKLYLEGIFDKTENVLDYRLDEAVKKEKYETLIADVEELWANQEKWNELEKPWEEQKEWQELKKLYHLVKGNIYLRKGQYEDERFEDSRESYHTAMELLQEYADPDEQERRESMNLLIQLSLGKCFRNMGENEKRSSFHIAIYEFEKVIQWLEAGEGRLDQKETQIWLNAKINIGRAHKKLYDLKTAEKCFLEIVAALDKKRKSNVVEYLKTMGIVGESEDCRNHSDSYDRMEGTEELYRSFLVQAMIQLAIVYRKKREYYKAEKLCIKVMNMEEKDNIDALNNLGVCFRKNEEFEKAIEIFRPLKKEKNRFAEINYWKCVLKQKEAQREIRGITDKDIKEFLKRGKAKREKADREIKLLQGRFLLIQEKPEKASEIFKELYEESPYIAQGTIGLKAYYNIATSLLLQKKFQQAAGMLEEILETYPQDQLARIDLGWCRMNMNQYGSAKEIYKKLCMDMGIETKETPGDTKKEYPSVGTYEKMKILNNLGECYLRTKDIENAEEVFGRVLDEEGTNTRTKDFFAQCCMLRGELEEEKGNYALAQEKYKAAISYLEEIPESEEKDNHVISKLIIARAAYQRIYDKKADWETKDLYLEDGEYKKYITKRLLYHSDTCYLKKSCCEIAKFLRKLEEEKSEDIDTLYRAFSRVRLSKQEEGYHAFSNFSESHNFLCLGAKERGRILAYLFLIHGEVTRIKEECRYSPSGGEVSVPVHYTSLEVLQLLLGEKKDKKASAKLRLWNTVYMNDKHEGECFLELLKDGKEAERQEILSRYFPHLNNNNENLSPVKGNVYITSLTNQRDSLWMWKTYGKKAQGCNITFADDFLDIKSRIDGPLGFPVYSDSDYPLYKIQYIDSEKLKEHKLEIVSKDTEPETAERIRESMDNIWKYLEELEEWLKKIPFEKSASVAAITGFVADALNEVRFLFKSSEYLPEQEMRMVSYSYKPKTDEKFDIPRLYTEVKRKIRIKEVMLGAEISQEETEQIVSWLYATGKVEKVTKSEKHLGVL